MDLVSLTSRLSPNIVEAGMLTTGRLSNYVGQDKVGMMPTLKDAADGSYVAMILNDAAPVPDDRRRIISPSRGVGCDFPIYPVCTIALNRLLTPKQSLS
jgi:hypothetical protein